MNLMFNLGQSEEQNILIMVDEFGTIEAHTHSDKEMHKNELELAEQYGKKLLFKMEVPKT